MYSIDWNKLVEQLLPWALRYPDMKAWLVTLIKPLVTLYNTFVSYRDSVRVKLMYTGQTIYLEKLLNDHFSSNGIYITHPARTDIYIGLITEDDPVLLPLRTESDPPMVGIIEDYESEYDFTINIPTVLTPAPTDVEVAALIDRYKLAGKSYNINRYSSGGDTVDGDYDGG